MLWWTLPLFLIVALGVDYYLSRFKVIVSGTTEEKLGIILLAPIVAPVIEELAFRWMPLTMFRPFIEWFGIGTQHSGLIAMLVFSFAWILAHLAWTLVSDHFKPQYVIIVAILTVYFCYLWYINMGWLAILLHSAYNTFFCFVVLRREPVLANWNFRNPSLARVAWNSKEIGMYRSWAKKLWK